MSYAKNAVLDAICDEAIPIPTVRSRGNVYNDLLKGCMTRNRSNRLTIDQILEHPYLEGAGGMRANWVADFQRYLNSRVR